MRDPHLEPQGELQVLPAAPRDEGLAHCILPKHCRTSPGTPLACEARGERGSLPSGNYSVGLNTICEQFPTVPCPRETTDTRWAQRSEVRSTAGQHLRHNKAAAVECWQQEADNKKTLFWILRRAVTQERYLVPFRCQEFPKHLHCWDTLLEEQLQGGLPLAA